MEINSNDIIVIPEGLEVPVNFPHMYHKIKHLHRPSIVFSSSRGFMNTKVSSSSTSKTTGEYLLNLLGLTSMGTKKRKDIFFRYVRIENELTGEYFHNKGATVLIDFMPDEGRFLFSYAMCNHLDNFNKLIAHNVCRERMEKGETIECINYDPDISILQNIFIAIGVQEGKYPLTEYDYKDILPEFYGVFTEEQKESLSTLRRLIRGKAKN